MDIQEKIQFWKNEVERAEQNGFYFDTQSMRDVIETVEEQQKEISDWKGIVKIHNDNGKRLAEKLDKELSVFNIQKMKEKINLLEKLIKEFDNHLGTEEESEFIHVFQRVLIHHYMDLKSAKSK